MDQSRLPASTPEATDFAHDAPTDSSPPPDPAGLGHRGRPREEEYDQSQPHHSLADEATGHTVQRSDSVMSQSQTLTPSRGGTLKKKQSLKKSGSLKRSSSRKSNRPGSVRSLTLGERERYADGDPDEMMNSPFYTPVPTTGNPTEILANRFQAWRKVLKDLITYYRDIQKAYDARSKALFAMSNVTSSTSAPPVFLPSGGIGDATQILNRYHKQALAENNRARSIEEDVIVQLSGLRSDLQQKIKEIKHLSGDFKNSVDKETEATRRAVQGLQEVLLVADTEPAAASGKDDPYIVRLGVDRQVERQIDEENYLHRAFLNLENSGRELESIVVGEIQKSYNAYAGILKREADEAYETVEALKEGPLAMAKDHEWDAFVDKNEHFVDPKIPVRNPDHIFYPGKDAPAAAEIRAGMLERKTKYLKSYTPGWFVLSPTHLHEFKSPDHVQSQTPVMSLYLPEQKLGSHSNVDSSSHKFILKGRQTGGMHRGHSWVLRAESRDTMLAWYGDIKSLIEKRGEERNAFVRRHARSVSGGSHKAGSVSSDGAMEEDEADEIPYSGTASQFDKASPQEQKLSERPQPGGRFPSELNVNRDLRVPLSPSSGTGSDDRDVIAAAGALPGSHDPFEGPARHEQAGEHTAEPRSTAGGLSRNQSEMSQRESNIQIERIHLGGERGPAPRSTSGDLTRNQSQLTQKEVYVPVDASQQRDEYMTTARIPATGLSRGQSEISQGNTYVPIADTREYNDLQVQQGSNPDTVARKQNYQPEYSDPLPARWTRPDSPQETAYHQQPAIQQFSTQHETRDQQPSQVSSPATVPFEHGSEYRNEPVQSQGVSSDAPGAVAYASASTPQQAARSMLSDIERPNSNYGDWMAPAAIGAPGAAAGNTEASAYRQHQQAQEPPSIEPESPAPPISASTKLTAATSLTTESPPNPDVAERMQPEELCDSVPQNLEPVTFAPTEASAMTVTAENKKQAILETTVPSATTQRPSATVEVQRAGTMGERDESLETALPVRPKLNSVETISDLHVPGEFPRSSAASAVS